jgi:hypothetical protein
MYSQEEKDKMAMKNATIDKFAAKKAAQDAKNRLNKSQELESFLMEQAESKKKNK